MSLVLAATGAGTALAEGPTLSDVLDNSGITATGYVDATFAYLTQPSYNANAFDVNQVALTLAKLPSSGFGATATIVAGSEAVNAGYAPGYGLNYGGGYDANGQFNYDLLQGYVQYATDGLTVIGGKFLTLAGAEVAAPTGNTNVTRSLLFWYAEPINHTGVRATFAATGTTNLSVGVNNGWNSGSGDKEKTAELGVTFAATKSLALAGAVYYGDVAGGKRTLVDGVLTWTATPSLTLVASADWVKQEYSSGPASTLTGIAAYANYALSDEWRTSVRVEYLDDTDGLATTAGQKIKEGTVTFGYAPAKNFELRLEGRYDSYSINDSENVYPATTQGWVQALYKF